eukprot:Protomagalhaensia_wolfi_Nauph_80__1608@NODE_1995_length_1251_cov_22_582508_g1561_i0_p1_GENE_NODE_1995_length_1251_cov_22_582508_g1561_i0NODE_1995_length_1251_cov_22_582508_g1561_i0_p1_ORF_typecomplete_len105_score14_75Doppel/PF11466_8/8_8e02Doppel/PF11466_8/5_4Doppel/PF11466_8/4_7e02_NODE_1995_length_1251_cov_22_582508_g1561_i063377
MRFSVWSFFALAAADIPLPEPLFSLLSPLNQATGLTLFSPFSTVGVRGTQSHEYDSEVEVLPRGIAPVTIRIPVDPQVVARLNADPLYLEEIQRLVQSQLSALW